jgi:hypothetical protein
MRGKITEANTSRATNVEQRLDWSQINHREIEMKLCLLTARLRSRVGEYSREHMAKLRTRSERERHFVGISSEEDLYWPARLNAEMRILTEYLKGVGDVYRNYCKRLKLPLGSQTLIEIYEKGIVPHEKGWVRDRLRFATQNSSEFPPWFEKAYETRAKGIIKAVLFIWNIEVEEAKSLEQLGPVRFIASGTERNVMSREESHPPYSAADDALFKLIGEADLRALTDPELWKRHRRAFQQKWPTRDRNSFRCKIFRIRRKHGIPAPKPKNCSKK